VIERGDLVIRVYDESVLPKVLEAVRCALQHGRCERCMREVGGERDRERERGSPPLHKVPEG